jgi:hypothetical protein
VQLEVPRDRADAFEPQIVKKRQRRLNGVDEIVLSLPLPDGYVTNDADEQREPMNRWAVDHLVISNRLTIIAQLASHIAPHLTPAGLEYQRQLLRQPVASTMR